MLTEDGLREHLDALGWEVGPVGENTLRTDRVTPQGTFPVYIRLQDGWLVASIVPFLQSQGTPAFELSRWLLRVNRDLHLAKFAYDEDGDVVLTVELPAASISRRELHAGLTELIATAEAQLATLRAAAGG
jgi:hypothetical protein